MPWKSFRRRTHRDRHEAVEEGRRCHSGRNQRRRTRYQHGGSSLCFRPLFQQQEEGHGSRSFQCEEDYRGPRRHGSGGPKAPRNAGQSHDSFEGDDMKAKRILIIDDERPLLETLEMFLTEKGYSVMCDVRGRGFEAMRPSLILM